MSSLDQLAGTAADIAMRAAAQYLRMREIKTDVTALLECLRSQIRVKLPEAMRDAREAIEANMGDIAQATFSASMRQAGIDAAKECEVG